MKKSDVMGRTITGIKQRQYFNKTTGTMVTGFDALVLDNGARIMFMPFDCPAGSDVDAFVVKKKRHRKPVVMAKKETTFATEPCNGDADPLVSK